MEHSAPEMQFEPKRPNLQVVTNAAPQMVRKSRTLASLAKRTILIRDQGFRAFRVY
jgi:hypothetical protein